MRIATSVRIEGAYYSIQFQPFFFTLDKNIDVYFSIFPLKSEIIKI